MYTKTFPYVDFAGKPQNGGAHFNLTEREVFRLLVQLQFVLQWLDSMREGEKRELKSDEVVEFYTAFENILLEAWGEPSDDGQHFRKGGKYEFEESALFNACMVEFVSNPEETGKLLEGILPKGLTDLVKKADANLIEAAKNASTTDQQALIRDLQAKLAAAEATQSTVK